MDVEGMCKEAVVTSPEIHSAWKDRIGNVPVEIEPAMSKIDIRSQHT
jgi:hypothetical protein